MKTVKILAALFVTAMVVASCGKSTPKEELKTDIDSLSYAFGVEQGQGVKDYLQNMEIDTAYIDEFIRGLNEGASSKDDKKKMAYNAGVGAGMNLAFMIEKQLNKNIFGEDSTKSISVNNFLAGFAASAKKDTKTMNVEKAREVLQRITASIQDKAAEKQFGKEKKANDAYMAKIAKAEGVKALKDGVYYKEVKAGTGAKPTKEDMVKINYVGKTMDGKVFDSRDGAVMPAGGAVPGFTTALLNMPVGSKWEIYIPYSQGYGSRQVSPELPPFSTLVFTVELVSIEKGDQNQAPQMQPTAQ